MRSGFAVLLLLAGAAQGQTAEKKPEAKPADYSDEPYVIEQLQVRFRFENDGTGRREIAARVRMQSEAGVERWGQLVLGYNSANERVEIAYVRVIKSDGKTVTAPPEAVQDLSAPVAQIAPVYTDFRQKHVTVPGLRPADTLEYQFVTVMHTPLAPGQFWMQYEFDKTNIVLSEELQLDVPRSRAVKLKVRPALETRTSEQGDRRIYRWSSSHLTREDEDKKKKEKKQLPEEPEPPAVQLTTFSSWQQVGEWYAGLERERRAPGPEIRAKAAELTRGRAPDLEKVQALYDFVAANFRYISLSFGIGRYQPHSAAEVLANQYGDCKDKHTLLASLLEAAGLHASSVLINSHRKLDPEVPSPLQFDHVITMVPVGGESIWLDTTTEVAPFRLLSFNLRNKQALVIAPDGNARLSQTPADPPLPNQEKQQVEGRLSELGELTAHVHLFVQGDPELLMRIIFRHVPASRWNELVQGLDKAAGIEGEVSNLKVGDPANTHIPFEIDYQVSQSNYLDWSGKESRLVLPLSSLTLTDVGEVEAGRSEPVKLGPASEFNYRLKLELPPHYTAHAPLPFTLTRDFADYRAGYKLEGNVFTAERSLQRRVAELPPARAPEYSAFRRAVLADLSQTLALENTASGALVPPPNLSADELNQAGEAALNNRNYQAAIPLFLRAVEVDPQHKSAWNNLGRAYLGQGQWDKAISAFRKQIEASPYDEYAYNNLGRALWNKRQYEGAAAAFRKQIEISPLDKAAHASLGLLYIDWRKYADAVPELQKAVSLTPDDPGLHVGLGNAYLHLDQQDKALAEFDRAVEIAPSPGVWNEVAYRLAQQRVRLDRAQRYAESAVTSVETALRNLSLDQITLREVGLVNLLAASWDTLGWVYFQEGALDQAEKYITAAWILSQHGEIGDHLAQIYEKRALKQKAVDTYALALNAERPEPETRARLAALLGPHQDVDALVARRAPELSEMRTIKLGRSLKQTTSADFFLLLSGSGPQPGAPSGPPAGLRVEGVKFISGDEKLRSFADTLQAASFPMPLPGGNSTRLLRRGILSCSATTGTCSFVLILPSDVRSVN